MPPKYVVIVEADLSSSAYGAKISISSPLEQPAALAVLERIARGEQTDVYRPYKSGTTVRVNENVLLDISSGRPTSTKQTRITVAEIVSSRP